MQVAVFEQVDLIFALIDYQIYQPIYCKYLFYIHPVLTQAMHYDPLLRYSQLPIPYSSISAVNSEIIDCIIRSDSVNKGSLHVSNLQGVQNINILKKLKVATILTCAEGYKLDYSPQQISNYKYFPLPENPIFGLNEYFTASSDFIQQSLTKSNCIVHCFTGQSKSIAVIIAYLMKFHEMGLDEALSYVKRKKKLINLDSRSMQSLKQFEKFIQKTSSTNKLKTSQNDKSTIKQKTQKTIKDQTINQSKILKQNTDANEKTQMSQIQNKKPHIKTYENHNISLQSQNKSLAQQSRISIRNNESSQRKKSSNEQSHVQNKILPTDNSRMLQNHNKSKIKTQNNSKLNTQNKFQNNESSVDHKEAIRFESVLSSNHVEYVGVKREFKNSSTSFKKEKGSMINFGQKPFSSKILSPQKNVGYLTIGKDPERSFMSQRKSRIQQQNSHVRTQKSEMKFQNQSMRLFTNEREKTKKTEFNEKDNIFLNVFNPENDGLEKSNLSQFGKANQRMKSKMSANSLNHSQIHQRSHIKTVSDQLDLSQLLSPAFELSPSKKSYFSQVNQQLNLNVKEILSTYQNEITDLRINYQNRLRHLRPSENAKPIA